jgi:ADP-ribosylglycohydrolase
MLGAIAGDIIGSLYEHMDWKRKDFPLFQNGSRFTDDTVLTVAVAQAILQQQPYEQPLRELGQRYPDAGYGGMFRRWLQGELTGPYNSYGNGSAMRVSPVALAFDDRQQLLQQARLSAAVTHDHPEGVRGAQALALAVWLARNGSDRDTIRHSIVQEFGYPLDFTADEIRPGYAFDVTCQGSVPQALVAFLESTDYEDAVRIAISLGGDADTLACMAGAVAEMFYKGVPAPIVWEVQQRLPTDLWAVVNAFYVQFCPALMPQAD